MARRSAKPSVPPRPKPAPWPDSKRAPARGPADRDGEDEGRAASDLGERIRRVALGLTAALVTARAFWHSEPNLNEGAGAGLAWVLVLLIVAGLGLAASLVAGRFRFRFSWTDVSVVAVVVLVAISASHAVDRRPAINLAWEWVALGVIYLLVRNLPRTRGESSALAGALVATAVAVSSYGLCQAIFEPPMNQAEFQRNRVQILQELHIEPGSRGEELLKNRLIYSNEIYSTFVLANSLAGFIVGPLVLVLAVGVYNLVQRDAPGSRWAVLGMAAPLILVMLVCLILTKSRSSYVGLIVGAGLLAWRARRQMPARELLTMGLAGLGVVAGLVVAGLVTGRLDREVLTQSAMSLRYRWEYWQGAWGVITGGEPTVMGALSAPTFWWGVGPGNFRAPYLMHKLPQASEEIVDPHNLFLEVWATGGSWALVALVAALASGIWILLGRSPPAGTSDDSSGGARPRGDARRQPAPRGGSNPRHPDDEQDAPPRGLGWLIASAGAGWALVVILWLNPFEGDLFFRWLILGASWLAAVLLGAPLWRRLPIPAPALGAAFVAVVINLFAAGGIGIPTVALGLWSMLALGLNLRDDRSCGRLREYDSRIPAFVLAVGWAALLGTFAGVVGPFWRSEAAIAQADAAINHLPPNFARAEQAYLSAIEADGYDARPWLKSAALSWLVWQERGFKVEDPEWRKIPILYQKAASAPRNPNSWALHADRAREILRVLSHLVGQRLEPLEVLKYRGKIVEATRTAARLNPTNAELHARLAEASAEISMYKDAVTEATEALRLDRITPHQDKKLPPAIRSRLEALIPKWTDNAAKMPIQAAP